MAVSVLGVGSAHAEGVDEINGWTVTPTSDTVELLTNNATLSDPGDTLGLGTSPIAGEWLSEPATPLSSIGSNESFTTPDALGSSSTLLIQDLWGPGFELTSVQVGTHNAVVGFLVPVDGGHEVVDLVNVGFGAAPLVNPDATGPVEVGGVQLASPHDGALLNDLAGALVQGEPADWSKAATLLADLLGTDPSGAVATLADPGTLDSAGSAASDSVPPVDLNDIAVSLDGLSFQTGTATATSSPGLFNVAVADGPHTFASASGLVFDLAAAVGEDSSANATGLVFSAAGVEGTGSTANSTDLLFGAAVVQGNDSTANAAGLFDAAAGATGNDDFAAAAGPLFTAATVKADDATAIAGPGVVDKAEALANGLTATARGFGVTDIVPSSSTSAAATTASDFVQQTGPVDVGGVQPASSQDGALFHDLVGAVSNGDAADFGKATTLFDDLLGANSAGATGPADPSTNAVAGAGAATADAPSSTTPDDLLTTAISNFTDANALLTATTSVEATQPLNFNSDALQLLDPLLHAQETISAHAGDLSGLFDQLFFVPLDQGWIEASDTALRGAQELAAASGGGLDIGLEVPSLQLIGDYLASLPIIGAAALF
ncbi:hypothetical protein [Mycobacterium sp.]|uniref:hypothetical protein n=1 Tax=Mycobacterium sp. TaxID=1785 RepID=UPI0012773812|nr:hypothetical protein [Mycobacterium sp.]KAA8969196.1 MAG: hypothetical protein F6Q13_03610 [Mycobacterium sp.]